MMSTAEMRELLVMSSISVTPEDTIISYAGCKLSYHFACAAELGSSA